MMAQNTERLQGLLKKHQSENTPNLESSLRWPTSECTPLAPLEVKGCWPVCVTPSRRLHVWHSPIVSHSILPPFVPSRWQIKDGGSAATAFPREPTPPPRPHHRSSSPTRPAAFSVTELASTELLRPSSSSINKRSWRPTSHWAVQEPQKTRNWGPWQFDAILGHLLWC